MKKYNVESGRKGKSKRKNANWIGHILRMNCFLKHVVERNIEGMRRLGRRRQQLMDNVKKKKKYCNLKEEALDRNLCRAVLLFTEPT